MTTVDDTHLVVLARKPAGELFVNLRRTGPLAPLMMVLCFVPGLYALQHASMSDADALWGLRAIACAPQNWPEFVTDLPDTGVEGVLHWQPPLATWITAGLIRGTGLATPILLQMPSYLACAGAIGMMLLLLRSVGTDRMAVWGVILTAGHAPLLIQATRLAPIAIGIALALAALWGFLGHVNRGTRRFSISLLLGGVALGLCSLAAGPLAVGAFVVMLFYSLGLRGESLSKRQYAEPRPIRVWGGWPALRSLLLLGCVAFTAGGFWAAFEWWDRGMPFLASWVFGAVPSDVANGVEKSIPGLTIYPTQSASRYFLLRILKTQGPLLTVSAGGLYLAVRRVIMLQEEKQRRAPLFLVCWFLAALLGWQLVLRHARPMSYLVDLWECFLSLSLVACAAGFVEAVSLRQISLHAVAGAMIAGVASLWLGGWQYDSPVLLGMAQVLLVAAGGGLVMIGANSLREDRGDKDGRQQVVLASLVLSLIAASVATGVTLMRRETPDDRALTSFRDALPRSSKVSHCTVIGNADSLPLRLRLQIKSVWPHVRFESASSWDAALTQTLSAPADRDSVLIVDWGHPESSAANLQAAGVRVVPVASPQFFDGGPLQAYLMTRDDSKTVDAETRTLADDTATGE